VTNVVRSSASDAISIQTHKMRGLTLRRGDPRALALGGIASLKIQAGERMVDVYRFAAANNLTVVGGAEPHVGIGGWISYGGHGPVSAYYGLGADQVLEMEIVTADGVLRTVNESSDADLFWALRGVSSVGSKYQPGIADSMTGRREQFWCDSVCHCQSLRCSTIHKLRLRIQHDCRL
jgi:FAD/FMN-containing dehydrogenase